MKVLEKIKLAYCVYRIRTKHDIGGIKYISDNIKRGQQVLDIGAHKGGYLYSMLKNIGSEGKLYAFEPQSDLYAYLVNLKSLYKWSNVRIEHLALSDQAGIVELYIPQNKTSQSSSPGATILKKKLNEEFNKIEEIQTQTLDAYCDEFQIQPDFLKIDVEGNELNIFKGGSKTLKTYKPKILVEIESRHVGEEQAKSTFEYLTDLGYRGWLLYGSDHLPIEEFSFEKHQKLPYRRKDYHNNFIFESII